MTGRLHLLACALILFTSLLPLRAGAAPQARTSLTQADTHYTQKSYAKALTEYESALKSGKVPTVRRDEVQYRIVVALGKTRRWDRALTQSLDFVKAHRGTVREPRGLYWLGRLYLALPHSGYRVGDRLVRGDNVPKTDSDAAPEPIDFTEQDARNARDALEAAHILFPTYRAAAHTAAEEIQLDFDLVRVLQAQADFRWAAKQQWKPPNAPDWKIDPAIAYSPKWPYPKKVLTLFAHVRLLAGQQARGAHSAVLALFGEALWLSRYHIEMWAFAQKWDGKRLVIVPYPYQALKPVALLHRLVREHPNDPIREQAQFTLALAQETDGHLVAAAAEFRRLIAARPGSKWVSDCRAHLQALTARSVSINSPGTQRTGQTVRIWVQYHNLKRLHFRVYRVALERLPGITRRQKQDNPSWTDFTTLFGSLKQARRFYGPCVAEWNRAVKDTGDYQPSAERVGVPVRQAGAYVVEATAPGVRAAGLLLLSDLAVVVKMHRDGGLFFVADSRTGKPIAGAHVLAKQWWSDAKNRQQAAVSHAGTAADGTAGISFRRRPGRSNFQMAAIVSAFGHYAVTDQAESNDSDDNPGPFKTYSTTGRAVYRPQQTVHFRQVVMRRTRGSWRPAAHQSVRVTALDPNDKVIYKRFVTTNPFGSVHGQFDLAAGAPLGEYTLDVSLRKQADDISGSGSNRFRVEEYKTPEFEVSVTPEAERVRLGQPTTARIAAKYYFGGPVPGAKVTYRVYRDRFMQSYRFPQPFDFLYGYQGNGDYDVDYRRGEVVAQGTAHTDDKGEAKVTFPTGPPPGDPQNYWDYRYTVEADVQDISRRVISGTGAVKATRHDVAAFLNFPHGYAVRGDRVDVEIMTLNPSDQPVSAAGTAQVFLQPETEKGKERLVHEEPLTTDSHGRAILKWQTARAGYFRIAFATRDSVGQKVSGEIFVWVEGPELTHGRFRYRGVTLAVQNPYYQEGQKAKVLLVTPEPGCSVLLTREANNEILERRVLRVPGRSLELSVPLTHQDVPNVFLSAVLVRDGQAFQATQELFVPPAGQFADVTVQADKPRYQPGEQATFRLHATDRQGRPLRTELCVSVADAALGYIQKDYAPDIRAYFYGDRRSQSIDMNSSFSVSFSGAAEISRPLRPYRTHRLQLPDGMGLLADWPGDDTGLYWQGVIFNTRAVDYEGGAGELAIRHRADPFQVTWGDPTLMVADRSNLLALAPAAKPMNVDRGSVIIPGDEDGAVFGIGKMQRRLAAKSPELLNPTLRKRFADTAFWTPATVTDAQGNAVVQVTWPDNLTQWRAVAVGNTVAAQVGSGEARVTTKKDLLVRLQAPRFFMERDRVVLSADVHNYLPTDAHVKVRLDLGSDAAEIVKADDTEPVPAGGPRAPTNAAAPEIWVDVPKDGEKRVDWTVQVRKEGTLPVRMTAQSTQAADAVETTLPVLIHGVERMTTQSRVLRDQSQVEIPIDLPQARKPGRSELVVQLDPSLATVMLDALPYLADYPYGCIEQTMSRFLPSIVVAKTLHDLGYRLDDLRRREALRQKQARQGGSQAVENSPYTYPQGQPGIARPDQLILGTEHPHSPVFDAQRLRRMTTEGLERIARFQHRDGGWGWWPDDTSDATMSAYVLYGLNTAQAAGVPVNANVRERGLKFLLTRFRDEDDLHRMAYEARVLAMEPRFRKAIRPLTTGRLYAKRERLSAYSKALLALALHSLGETEKAGILLDNLENTATIDAANGTASWDACDASWWRWYNDRAETNAAVLQAVTAIRPHAPLTAMLMKWLVVNRRGGIWNSTEETAMAVYALADYARANKELAPDYTLTVDLDGRVRRSYRVTHENALLFDNRFTVPDELLHTGRQTLTLTKAGRGVCYVTAFTRTFSQEDSIPAAGNEVFVRRRYFRLLPGTASGTPQEVPLDADRPNPFLTGRYDLLTRGGLQAGEEDVSGGPRYRRVALQPGDTTASGDLLEVELQLEAKNDFDYVLFEDIKPAGCEPVELRSGERYGNGLCSNMELRDQKTAFFLSHLPQGTHTLTYRLRAELPGRFNVLPANGYAMYAPDIRTLSDEMRLHVRDEETENR